MMVAARIHQFGQPMQLDVIPVPEPGPTDVLVEVKACGVVPNLQRVIKNFFGHGPNLRLMPELPTIFGLDPAGIVSKVGNQVISIRPGDRVYVSPARSCGSCRTCRGGEPLNCPSFTFQGYFGRSKELMKAYPYGGLCQYITAPQSALVTLPDNVRFEVAARFGYLGTAYSAMKKLGVGPGHTFLVNGISGTLGLNAAMVALAMGAAKILGIGRNAQLLDRVKAIAPDRIDVFSSDGTADPQASEEGSLSAWIKSHTDGYGVDSVLDCLPPGAPANAMLQALYALRRGGNAVNVGALMEAVSLDVFWLMGHCTSLRGSVWFTTGEGQELANMVSTGILDTSVLQHRLYPLSKINEALSGMDNREGGFTNFVIDPSDPS